MISMERKIQELENKIKELESKINYGNFQSAKQFDNNVIFKNGITVDNGKILLRSKSNNTGVYLLTGNQINDAGIKAEVGTAIGNGSIYMSSSITQPILINVNGTWTLLNIP